MAPPKTKSSGNCAGGPDFDLVVLAPQAASYLADLQKDCERVGNKCVACRGKQYIELSQNGDKSLAFVSEQLSK